MSDKLHVGRGHLWKGFDRHRAAARVEKPTESQALLELYAIECALKAVLLRERRQFSTEHLDEDDLTHELDELLRRLGQHRLCVGQYTAAEPESRTVSSGRLHQLFRYGGRLDAQGRQRLRAHCEQIFTWLEEQPR